MSKRNKLPTWAMWIIFILCGTLLFAAVANVGNIKDKIDEAMGNRREKTSRRRICPCCHNETLFNRELERVFSCDHCGYQMTKEEVEDDRIRDAKGVTELRYEFDYANNIVALDLASGEKYESGNILRMEYKSIPEKIKTIEWGFDIVDSGFRSENVRLIVVSGIEHYITNHEICMLFSIPGVEEIVYGGKLKYKYSEVSGKWEHYEVIKRLVHKG